MDFSDFGLLPIIRNTSATTIMTVITKLSLAFLDDRIDDGLREVKTRDMDTDMGGKGKDGKPKRRLIGNAGDVIVH
jgi:platelet-activating factor acetylhydrolase